MAPETRQAAAEEALPIDINYAKLADWLLSRKKLAPDWRKRLTVIQAQASSLSKDLPAALRPDGASSTDGLDYHRCKAITEELSKTAERGVFGVLKGAAKEWEKVTRVYEKGNVFLGESAATLVSNTDYEIPFLRKQVALLNSQLVDLERKTDDLVAAAKAAAINYKSECQSLGIEGKNILPELSGLVKTLPKLFEKCVEACRSEGIGSAVTYYSDFSTYSSGESSDTSDILATLCEVRNGTTAAAETLLPNCITDLALASEDPPAAMSTLGGSDTATDVAVNWDIGDGAVSAAPTLNWDVDVTQEENTELPEVNWDVGIVDSSSEPTVQLDIDVSEAAPTVDWDIGVADAGAGAIDWDIGVSDHSDLTPDAVESHAADDSTLVTEDPVVSRLMNDLAYRSKLIDDLIELQAFLAGRHIEMRGTSAAMLLARAPRSIQHVSMDGVASMLAAVNEAVSEMSEKRMQLLIKIKTSPKYTSRLVHSLEMKGSQEARIAASIREVERKRADLQRQMVLGAKKVLDVVEQTRALKVLTERNLSDMVKRKVNIMGEINATIK